MDQLAGLKRPYDVDKLDMNPRSVKIKGSRHNTLFVRGLNLGANEEDVLNMFWPYDNSVDVTLCLDGTDQEIGCAYVTFCDSEMAEKVRHMFHKVYRMRGCREPLFVRFAQASDGPEFGHGPPVPTIRRDNKDLREPKHFGGLTSDSDSSSIIHKVIDTLTKTKNTSISKKRDPTPFLDPDKYIIVKELHSSMVLRCIKTILQKALTKNNKIKKSFFFSVPSRSPSNNVFVKEVRRICMLKGKNGNTKPLRTERIVKVLTTLVGQAFERKQDPLPTRTVYYVDSMRLGTKRIADSIIKDVCLILNCPRRCLNLAATGKGQIIGDLEFIQDGVFFNCLSSRTIPSPGTISICNHTKALFILVIEKQTIYSALCDEGFHNKVPCIMMTSRGYPDIASRFMLRNLEHKLKLPVLGLFDCDPNGARMVSVYKYGSKMSAYDSESLAAPSVKWLGLRHSDLKKHKILKDCKLPLTVQDPVTASKILEADYLEPDWVPEIKSFLETKKKMSIEALTKTFGVRYFIDSYLMPKLKDKGWI